jgi:class 3 adenylate cyclase
MAPGGPPFTEMMRQCSKGLAYIEAGKAMRFDVEAEPGLLAAYDAMTGNIFEFAIQAGRTEPNAKHELRLQDGHHGNAPIVISPGKVTIELRNDSEQRNSVLLMHKPQAAIDQYMEMVKKGMQPRAHFDKFLSGRRLLTSQTFRQMFGNETIRSTEGIGVRDISILFTDLKGSTSMYDRIGDLKAFALVNQHFERLGRAIGQHRGAVVKTIGDAVMASFENPADAVLAARDMLREIESFNREEGHREIILKVGVHRGASIAVTLNDRLDFFGQTVNIAARVQGLADADEIYITDEVYREPGVAELLREFHVTPQKANLKGIQRTVNVHRVASSAERMPSSIG